MFIGKKIIKKIFQFQDEPQKLKLSWPPPDMGALVGAEQERQPELGALVGAVQERHQVELAPQPPILFSPTAAIPGRRAHSVHPIRMGQRHLFQEILLAIYRQVNSSLAVVMIKS